jgi:hypothetical protein
VRQWPAERLAAHTTPPERLAAHSSVAERLAAHATDARGLTAHATDARADTGPRDATLVTGAGQAGPVRSSQNGLV